MRKMFQFIWQDGKKETAVGTDWIDALKALGYDSERNIWTWLSSWREVPMNISDTSDCGCTYHAEDGIPCEHDIAAWEKLADEVDSINGA